MRAIEILRPGAADMLVPCERPMPVAGVGEVLIEVHAASVNRLDIFQRMGKYPVPAGTTDIPGLDVAGRIVAGDTGNTGEAGSSGSIGLKIGDMVCALAQGGGYAQYCVVPFAQCLPMPAGLSALEAASLPETFFTVWSNVFDRAKLQMGETLLVQGGSSGIGVAAIQIATALGHRVFATAGTDDKCRACEGLGAERAINYRTEDFVELIRAATDHKGVDVILDMVGGPYLERHVQVLADDGRLALIALLGGASAELDLGQLLRRRLTVTGATLRARPVAFKAAIAQRLQKNVWPLLETGRIKPVIFKTFALEQAAQAHALMESGSHVGKIMLDVQSA